MRLLGVPHHLTLGAATENEFDLVGRAALIRAVDTLLGQESFDEVFVCLPSLNQDHTALYEATLAAFRPGRWPGVKRIWAYTHPGNTAEAAQGTSGRCYVKIEGCDMKSKVSALWEHKSQFDRKPKGPDRPEGAMILARQMGSLCGAEFAEVFWLIREVY